MDKDQGRWPSFGLKYFSVEEGGPSAGAMALLSSGVPQDLFGDVYRALDNLAIKSAADGRDLICVGEFGSTHFACLDPQTGAVVELSRAPEMESPAIVNSSLENFSETIRFLVGRFPFYGEEVDLDFCEEVAQELASAIREIDREALTSQDSFWSSFIDDVAIGDYPTEDVLDG